MKGITALILFITIASFLCANIALLLSQESSTFRANFENAKGELADISAEIDNFRALSGNETSELRTKISELKSELGIEDTEEIEEVKAKIVDEKKEIERINKTLPIVEGYCRNRILRYGVYASLGLIIGIWVSILIFSFAWRRRE